MGGQRPQMGEKPRCCIGYMFFVNPQTATSLVALQSDMFTWERWAGLMRGNAPMRATVWGLGGMGMDVLAVDVLSTSVCRGRL